MTMQIHDETRTGLALSNPSIAVARTGDLMPRSLPALMELAKMAATSGLAKVQSPEQAATIIMTGIELGLTPMQALRGIYVVEGRPFLSADLMIALVLQSGTCEEWEVVETDDEKCVIRTKRTGRAAVKREFTAEDAKRADLVKDKSGHGKYPRVMLYHRCCAVICREVWPDILLGMYVPEEQADVVATVRGEAVTTRVVESRTAPVAAAAGGSDGGGRKPPSTHTDSPIDATPERDWRAEIETATTLDELTRLGDELRAAAQAKAIDIPTSQALGAVYKARKTALSAAQNGAAS